jgi:hypothetical protein
MTEIALRYGGECQSEQVGLLLKWSPNWAADRVDLAEKVVDRLPASLDLYKVQTVHELTMNLSPEHAREVEDRVLERAADQTGAQMRQRARRIVMRVDPRGATERGAEAKAQRSVGLESEDDGMAKLYAYVPADKAVAIKLRVDKIARLVTTPQDDRMMDDVPSASPPQTGPPLDGVPAESGMFRMDDSEQPDLHPRTDRGLMH